MPGTISAKMYAPKSNAEYTTAVDWNPDKNETNRWRNNGKEILGLSDGGEFNYFEGTVKYEVNGKTFYLPVGPGFDYVLKTQDDVLRTMTAAAWFKNGKQFQILGKYDIVPGSAQNYIPLTSADSQSVD